MADRTNDDSALHALLSKPRRIALVGASPSPDRPSHRVMAFLQATGHDVIPVNPVADEVLGVPCVTSVVDAAQRWGEAPEIVDVFRAPHHVPSILDDALDAGASWLWLQLGVIDEESKDRAVAAGMDVVMDRCIKIEQARLV